MKKPLVQTLRIVLGLIVLWAIFSVSEIAIYTLGYLLVTFIETIGDLFTEIGSLPREFAAP